MDVKTHIAKDRAVGVWNVHDEDMTYPAASWGEALQFVHALHKNRAKVNVLTKPQIVAEEYKHFTRILGPELAKQRLGTVYGITRSTLDKYIREGRNADRAS